VSKKLHRRDFNLRPTDPETDALTTQPPRLAYTTGGCRVGISASPLLPCTASIYANGLELDTVDNNIIYTTTMLGPLVSFRLLA